VRASGASTGVSGRGAPDEGHGGEERGDGVTGAHRSPVPDALAVEILDGRGVSADAARRALAQRLDVDTAQLVVPHRRRRRLLARTR
jgi:hypothetical protein